MDLLHREHQQHPIISAGTGVGYGISGYRRTKHAMSLKRLKTGPSRRGKGKFSQVPRCLEAPSYGSKLLTSDKGVSDGFFLTSNIHEIHFPAGLRSGPRWEADDAPRTPSRMVLGHPSQVSFLRSRRKWNEVVIGPRKNGFPGPGAAVDGPGWR